MKVHLTVDPQTPPLGDLSAFVFQILQKYFACPFKEPSHKQKPEIPQYPKVFQMCLVPKDHNLTQKPNASKALSGVLWVQSPQFRK
jgi:hypothetical protein